jgi:hypothetical protein
MRIKCRLSHQDQRHLLRHRTIEVERSRRIAYEGDWLEIDGFCFVLTSVRICTNPEHKHKRPAFIHTFKSQRDLARFHIHTIWDGRCTQCGFVPDRETAEAELKC